MSTASSAASAGRTAWARNLAAPIRELPARRDRRGRRPRGGRGRGAAVGERRAELLRRRCGRRSSRSCLGGHELAADLRGWVNEGLMTLFFLVVGLEAKRELDLGELRERTAAGDPGRRLARRDGRRAARSTSRSTPAATARTAGARRSRPTRRSRSARSRCSRAGAAIRLRVFLLTLVVIDDLVGAARHRARLHRARLASTALAVAIGLFGVLHRAALGADPGAGRRRCWSASGSGSRCSSRASTP